MRQEYDFKRLEVTISPEVVERYKDDIVSKNDDSLEDFALNSLVVKGFCERLATTLCERLRAEERSTFDISKHEAISEANPVGLMEAIQILGLPAEMRIARPALVPNPVYEYGNSLKKNFCGASCTSPYGSIDVEIMDPSTASFSPRPYDDTSPQTRISFSYPSAYVDFTFRLPLTDELRAYLPEIKDRYETVKRIRDYMFTGKNPLDEE